MLDFKRLRKEAFVIAGQKAGFDSAVDSARPVGQLRTMSPEVAREACPSFALARRQRVREQLLPKLQAQRFRALTAYTPTSPSNGRRKC